MASPVVEFQQPNRSEIVTFGAQYCHVLPEQIKRLNVSRVYLVASKSLLNSSSELETLKQILGEKLVGMRIGL